MKSYIHYIILMLGLVAIVTSCSGGKNSNASGDEATVTLSSLKEADTLSFPLSNGNNCKVQVDVSVTYPKSFVNKQETEKLQKLFITTVLECGDSLTIEEAVKQYTTGITRQNGASEDEDDDFALEDENGTPIDKILINVNITAAYNQKNIITFCKEVTYKRNDVVTSKMHRYYNLDLADMKPIDRTIFRDDAMSDVCQLLKDKLLEQTHTRNSDELNEIGYFNIDNLSVTDNFCFEENGITWSYLPQELAADALFEPRITLGFDVLKPLAAENSVINRF